MLYIKARRNRAKVEIMGEIKEMLPTYNSNEYNYLFAKYIQHVMELLDQSDAEEN